MTTPTLQLETDSTNVWVYTTQTAGTDLGLSDGEQQPHTTAAMRVIAQAMCRRGLRHAIIDGDRVDMRAWASRDSYCRKYLGEYAAA